MAERTDHAPRSAERPDGDGVRDGGEWYANDNKQQIGNCQTDDERVGGAAHLQVGDNDDDDRQVTDEAEDRDDAEHDRHDDAYNGLGRQRPRCISINAVGAVQPLAAAVSTRR